MKIKVAKTKINQIKKDIINAESNGDKFDSVIPFKLPKHIKDDLRKYCEQMNITLSDVIRNSLKQISIRESNFDIEALRILNKTSVNLNQLARALNQANLNNSEINLKEVYEEIQKLNKNLEKIHDRV